MSVPLFLEARFSGGEAFLSGPAANGGDIDERLLAGRAHYLALVSEILPRALLSELGLAKALLGASGGDRFLLVLPSEVRESAEQILSAAAAEISERTLGLVYLRWAFTENLGSWSDIRKRLDEALRQWQSAPAAGVQGDFFRPFQPAAGDQDTYFRYELGTLLPTADEISWSPEQPGTVRVGEGKYSFSFARATVEVPLPRHSALNDSSDAPADTATLAQRAAGQAAWGVLKGSVDGFAARLARAQTVEEYIQLSVLYKQFFAGELEMLCSQSDFFRKVSLLSSGVDQFAIYGSWDALIALARELHRLFQRLSETTLKEFPGPEGKTLTMAVALAAGAETPLAQVYEEAREKLALAVTQHPDGIYLFGRTLPWKQVTAAEEIQQRLVRLMEEYGHPGQFLYELGRFYREPIAFPGGKRQRADRLDRPWRFHLRLERALGPATDREQQNLRAVILRELIGKTAAPATLRPAGRVALEWATMKETQS